MAPERARHSRAFFTSLGVKRNTICEAVILLTALRGARALAVFLDLRLADFLVAIVFPSSKLRVRKSCVNWSSTLGACQPGLECQCLGNTPMDVRIPIGDLIHQSKREAPLLTIDLSINAEAIDAIQSSLYICKSTETAGIAGEH